MKSFSVYLLTTITLVVMLSACGPSQEEQRQREQARQDSLEQVRQQKLEQARQDSIARAEQARADSLEAARKKEEEAQQIEFDPNGPLAVQVEAWRSRDKAEGQVSKWQERGFPNAYVVKHGNEETGDIWFRVRLGRVSTAEMADKIGKQLQEEYDEKYWVAEVQGEGTTPDASD
ncbi:SPOR domain-containing protein [Halalkalibaculum sp. DA3122]|uniref:SPOR domain-containing protein n=1 Tax=Halalkalibaculum sp. DA3122 TaxID=3373607 RepID=UPI003754D7A3